MQHDEYVERLWKAVTPPLVGPAKYKHCLGIAVSVTRILLGYKPDHEHVVAYTADYRTFFLCETDTDAQVFTKRHRDVFDDLLYPLEKLVKDTRAIHATNTHRRTAGATHQMLIDLGIEQKESSAMVITLSQVNSDYKQEHSHVLLLENTQGFAQYYRLQGEPLQQPEFVRTARDHSSDVYDIMEQCDREFMVLRTGEKKE